jgi:hypothetical protein
MNVLRVEADAYLPVWNGWGLGSGFFFIEMSSFGSGCFATFEIMLACFCSSFFGSFFHGDF